MKFLTREEVYKLSAEESQKYYDDMLALRRFACAMVKDSSKPAIGKLESRCQGRTDNFLSYESSMYVYLTNAIYRHILGEENLANARTYKNRALDSGKSGITIPSVLSLPALVHLKNYYHYIDNKLIEDSKLKFRSDKDIQDFLRETRKEYAKDICVNYAFTGRTDDCFPTSIIAKPISSLDKLMDNGRIKGTKDYPVFDEYTIKSMEISEYLLSRANVLYRNPLHIKAMEEALEEERLDIVKEAGKNAKVQEFYTGSVSEVLAKMKSENEKTKIIENATKRKVKSTENVNNLSESQNDGMETYGGNDVVGAIKNAMLERNSVNVKLVDVPTSANEGIVKNHQPELISSIDWQEKLKIGSFTSSPKEEYKNSSNQPKNEQVKTIDSEISKLRYLLAKGKLGEDEFYEEVEKLRSGAGEQLTLFDTVQSSEEIKPNWENSEKRNIGNDSKVKNVYGEDISKPIEDEDGQIRLF